MSPDTCVSDGSSLLDGSGSYLNASSFATPNCVASVSMYKSWQSHRFLLGLSRMILIPRNRPRALRSCILFGSKLSDELIGS